MQERCPVCLGTGFEIRTGTDGISTAAPCACGLRGRGERLLSLAGIPRRYAHCTLDDFEIHDPTQRNALKIAREWIERWPDRADLGLLFLGGPGTGKTHLAVGIARSLIIEKGARVLFRDQRDLLKEIQSTFDSGGSRGESEVLAPVFEAEVLVLDDVGAGRTTPWARDVMHDIVVQRYNAKLPLIMTSNRPTGDDGAARPDSGDTAGLTLSDRLGEPLMSRLYEMCLIVPVEGKDFRRGVLHAKHHF